MIYLLILAFLFLSGCSQSFMVSDGAGSETTNSIVGTVIFSDGKPAPGVQVLCIHENYNPVYNEALPEPLIDTTDLSGSYSFAFTDSGIFNIQTFHLSLGARSLITGIPVYGDTIAAPYGILKETGTIKIYLPDTVDTVNGYLYIEGTTLSSSLSAAVADSEGIYVLVDSVPEARIHSIRYGILNDPSAPVRLTDTVDVISNQTTEADGFVFWANYTKENTELPGNRVNDISISPTTFAFATSNGIAVLGPTSYWSLYTAADIGLNSGNILGVYYIQYRKMWIATYEGAAALDGDNWILYTTGNSGIPTNRITDVDIELGGYGDVWFGTADKGLLMYDDSVWAAYDTANSDIPSNGVLSVFIDRGDTVWCTTQNGVFKLKGSYSKALTSLNSGIPAGDIYCMAIGNNRDRWFGYYGGVARWVESNDIWTLYTSAHSAVFTDSVLTIAEDEDGSMLFGTPKGMCRFSGAKWHDYTGSRYRMLADKKVRTIVVDHSGNKWVGSADNGVIIFGPTVK